MSHTFFGILSVIMKLTAIYFCVVFVVPFFSIFRHTKNFFAFNRILPKISSVKYYKYLAKKRNSIHSSNPSRLIWRLVFLRNSIFWNYGHRAILPRTKQIELMQYFGFVYFLQSFFTFSLNFYGYVNLLS